MADGVKSGRVKQAGRRDGHGFVRLTVRRQDAALLQAMAVALASPAPQPAPPSRSVSSSAGLKALLAAAPLEGIELDRPADLGRDPSL